MEGFWTTPEVAEIAGASYRQVDYWCRTGALSPLNNGRGSGGGRVRLWTEDEIPVVAVLVELSALGATSDVWTAVAAHLSVPPAFWPDRILVEADGRIPDRPEGTGWLLDLASIRDRVTATLVDRVGS